MAATIHTFQTDLKAFAKHLDIELATVIQRITLDLWNRLVLKTPVDTGRARAGWTVSIGAPSDFKPAKGNHAPPTAPSVEGITGEDVVWVLNNVEYIQPLENGHSKQAPAGMLRISIAEIELELETLMQ